MMEGDYNLPSLHCYTMNSAPDTVVASHPPPAQQQQPTTSTNTTPTTTPLKRTRAKRSCDFCRQRKSRCDADTCSPCTNCKAWGYTCEFQTVRKKRGPPSVYVDNLEKRCKKMEQLLMQLTNTPIKDLEQNDFRTTHRRAISDPSIVSDSSSDEDDHTGKSYSPIAPSPPLDTNDDIVHRLGKLDIHDYDSIKYTGQSAGLELLDQDIFKSKPYIAWPGRRDTVLQMMADDQLMVVRTEKSATTGKIDTRLDVGISIISVPSSSTTITNTTHTNDKPPKSLVTRMVTLYFTHLHPILPIINKLRFLHLYETHSPLLPKVLLQALLAVAFRFAAQQQQEDTSQTERYADYFFRKVMKKLQQESSRSRLCQVQAGLLLTLYLDLWHQPDSNNTESVQWQVLGQAIRMAQDLGLHRTCEHWHLPASEIETRHRVFYACYVLDRWIGARAGKPLTILDRDFDTAMPSMYEVDSDDRRPVYRSFILWIKLSEILGRVLKALYAPSAKKANANANLDDPMILVVFDRRLKHWHALLDESVDNTYLPTAQKVSLQIYYNTIILLLRRPFLSTSSHFTVDEHLVSESRQLSLQAALTICQLIQQNKPQQITTIDKCYVGPSHLLPTCYVYAMFLSSLVHVAAVLQDRTSIKKRRALAASIGLMESHQHLYASRRALEILHMLTAIHEIKPASPNQDDDAMDFKQIKLEQTQHDDYMVHHYNTQEETDDILDPYRTTTSADDDNRSHLAFQPSPFDSHFMTSSATTTSTPFIETEMPKSQWFQRFVNTSVVGGVTSEIHHDVATDLSQPTSYICPPPTSHPQLIAPTQPQSTMFYTPYMPSPPMPSSASPSTSATDLHAYQHHHHLPILSTASPEEQPSSAPSSSSSSSSHHPLLPTTRPNAPCHPMIPMPLVHQPPAPSMNWHDWQFYMHQHPPSSPLSK